VGGCASLPDEASNAPNALCPALVHCDLTPFGILCSLPRHPERSALAPIPLWRRSASPLVILSREKDLLVRATAETIGGPYGATTMGPRCRRAIVVVLTTAAAGDSSPAGSE
jgi:hypothetical protein